jgi:hypothetical protein
MPAALFRAIPLAVSLVSLATLGVLAQDTGTVENTAGLGLSVTQDGKAVPLIETMTGKEVDGPNGAVRLYLIQIQPKPFSLILPMQGCEADTEATMIRVQDAAEIQPMVEELDVVAAAMSGNAALKTVFQDGYGMAADEGPVTTLMVDEADPVAFNRGFNYFFAERYSAVDTTAATLTVEHLDGTAGDALTGGKPFLMVIGREGCPLADGQIPIDLVEVTFGGA